MNLSSIFHNYTQHIEVKPLSEILSSIKDGTYQSQVGGVRKYLEEGNIEQADKCKKKLPAFTTCGTFLNGRKADLLTQYSGYVILDIDKLSPQQVEEAKSKSIQSPYTYSAFISPSGNGLKIIVPVNSKAEQHKPALQQVCAHYEQALQLAVDPSGKDVSRLCFMSFDPELYLNPSAELFQVKDEPEIAQTVIADTISIPEIVVLKEEDEKYTDRFHQCIAFTEKKSEYAEGNRNNFIHLLACNCNREGIPEPNATRLILQEYDLDSTEATTSIESGYQNNKHEFAKYANLANSDTAVSKDELLMKMPFLPESIYTSLPEIIKSGCAVLEDRREKDIYITAALAILSGCMHNVYGLYRGKEVNSNLFIFIIAPPASGKGAITYAKQLGDKYHDVLVAESQKKQKQFEMEMAEYKRTLMKSKGSVEAIEPPDEPPFKVLFIPANNSSARIIQHLKEGDEQGIFCETEADTMGNVLKQDWGSYSDLLRKAFHHEQVSYSRKTGKEWIEIKKPRLSVALAGTPGQVEGLIKSAEDGLFSRFLFYTFKSDVVWIDAGPTIGGVNLSRHFEVLSEKVFSFVEFLNTQPEVEFHLTSQQWEKLNRFGDECLTSMSTFVSEDLASTSKRFGLILYRICMIFTALRYFDNAESDKCFTCSDDDFNSSMEMMKVYQEHSIFMFKELPKAASVTDKVMKSFFDALPKSFRRKDAVSIADKQFSIKERTADLYLSKLVAFKWLNKAKSGIYNKDKKT